MNKDITPENIIHPPKETYLAKAHCSNCDYEWNIEIQKGIPMEFKQRVTKCPKCECEDTVHIRPFNKWR